ncbi:hypothetical protein DRH14_03860 [Candidatus Shapirobacteria bacterium]|nr:MAG: hypothetical protein DRH14_03860 [Candidatus Shapirobacteria bacterium]
MRYEHLVFPESEFKKRYHLRDRQAFIEVEGRLVPIWEMWREKTREGVFYHVILPFEGLAELGLPEQIVRTACGIWLKIPSEPTVIKEYLYPEWLEEEVYYPEYGYKRKLLYRFYDSRSFRRIPIMRPWHGVVQPVYGLLVACPIGHWDEEKKLCDVAQHVLQIWHPYPRKDILIWRAKLPPSHPESLCARREYHLKKIREHIEKIAPEVTRKVAGFYGVYW